MNGVEYGPFGECNEAMAPQDRRNKKKLSIHSFYVTNSAIEFAEKNDCQETIVKENVPSTVSAV